MLVGVALVARPSVALLAFGIATDWIDGAVARRGPIARYGPRFDLEADSVLTLGAAIAASRRRGNSLLLVAPLVRYAVVAIRDPRTYSADDRFWDRASGMAQMTLLAAALSSRPLRTLALATFPVTAGRCAVLAALVTRAVHSVST